MSVYFCRVGRYVKIGHSYDPWGRSRSQFQGAGKPLDYDWRAPHEMLLVAIGGREEEQHAHHALVDHCMYGEWFADCVEVREFIKGYPTTRGQLIHQYQVMYPRAPIKHARAVIDQRLAVRAEGAAWEAECGHVDPPLTPIDSRPAELCERHVDNRTWVGAEAYDAHQADIRAHLEAAWANWPQPA